MKQKTGIEMHIGGRVKSIREDMNLTQGELAEKSGVSKSQISRLETGEQKNPQIETVVAISTALGVSIEELVFGVDQLSVSHMQTMLEQLPEEDQRAIKKFIKGWILATQSEKLNG